MKNTATIIGGNRLIGEVSPIPNKNAILPALAVSVLTNEDVVYHKVPRSTDVNIMLRILEKLGAKIDSSDYDNLVINCRGVKEYRVDEKLGSRLRSSIFLVGPLLNRFGRAEVPVPGGCLLGKRSIAAHVDVFSKIGVEISYTSSHVLFTVSKKIGHSKVIWQTESSVSATENFFLYVAGIPSEFTLIDAASEPHVSQLLNLLVSMGVDVDGISSNKVTIRGKDFLNGAHFTPEPDHVDVLGYIVAAAITDGRIRIKGANKFYNVGGFLNWFPKLGVSVEQDGSDLVAKRGSMKINYKSSGLPLAGDKLVKFCPRPWPGFPVDCLPPMVTLACKLDGNVFFNNWMYESGMGFVEELKKIGARIEAIDSQKVIVHGPVKFVGGEVFSPEVIQACKAIFLASLADRAETVIHGVDILKRRYPDIFATYKKLGARIEI